MDQPNSRFHQSPGQEHALPPSVATISIAQRLRLAIDAKGVDGTAGGEQIIGLLLIPLETAQGLGRIRMAEAAIQLLQ